jgi:integrase
MRLIDTPAAIDPQLAAAIARYSAAGVSTNTVRAYRSAWGSFERWCTTRRLAALPAAPWTCAAYLADRAGAIRPSSLTVHLAAIRQAHASRGFDSPTDAAEVLGVIKGVRREHGLAPRKKTAITSAQLRTLVGALGTGLRDHRDKALLLLGFCAGFRRSELVGLDVADVVFRDEGLIVRLRRSKTDQEQTGRSVAVEYGVHPETCPGAALEDWLMAAGIKSGPIFRPINRHGAMSSDRLEGRAVARVLQGRAAAAGLNAQNLGGHSLRSGLATAAAYARIDERDIARRTGHRNLGVMRGYIQDADPFAASLTQRLGF